MARGYFWSILFMMSMPFLILGGMSTYFYYLVRKARVAQAGAVDRTAATVGNVDNRQLVKV